MGVRTTPRHGLHRIDAAPIAKMQGPSIYVVLLRDFALIKLPVFKVGRSGNFQQRVKAYPPGSLVLGVAPVVDDRVAENALIAAFHGEFHHRRDLGSEYFQPLCGYDAACDAAYRVFTSVSALHLRRYPMQAVDEPLDLAIALDSQSTSSTCGPSQAEAVEAVRGLASTSPERASQMTSLVTGATVVAPNISVLTSCEPAASAEAALGSAPAAVQESELSPTPSLADQPVKTWDFRLTDYTPSDDDVFQSWTPHVTRLLIARVGGGDSGVGDVHGRATFRHTHRTAGVKKLLPRALWEPMPNAQMNHLLHSANTIMIDIDNRKQGKRSDLDLEVICERIKQGMSLRDVAREYPAQFVKYKRGITALHRALIDGGDSTCDTQ